MIKLYLLIYEHIWPPVIAGSHVITARCHLRWAFVRAIYNPLSYDKPQQTTTAPWHVVSICNLQFYVEGEFN